VFLRQPLAALPTEALTLVIEREAAFARLQPEVNATRLANLRQVLRGGSGEVRFGDTTVEVSCGLVRAGPALTTAAYDARILNVPGATGVGSWRVEVATGPFASGPAGVAVNAETAQGALRARPLAPGDHIRTPTGLRKASNLLVARKVPRWERDGALALADGQAVLALLEPPLVILPPGPEPLHVRAVPLPAR